MRSVTYLNALTMSPSAVCWLVGQMVCLSLFLNDVALHFHAFDNNIFLFRALNIILFRS